MLIQPTEVTMSKDVPGFVSNALLMPFINEVRPAFTSPDHAYLSPRQLCVSRR